MTKSPNSSDGFSNILRDWRKRRRLSQLELSTLASISSRHISFLEKGRAKPSRNMVLKLASALDISPGDTNVALAISGFSNAFPETTIDDESVEILHKAVSSMLNNHQPYPALVCDQSWKLLKTNSAADYILELLGARKNYNLMFAMLAVDDPEGVLINWVEVAHLMLRRMDAEQLQKPYNETLQSIRAKLRSHWRLQGEEFVHADGLSVYIPIKLRVGETVLTLISMIAQFGGVQEITYSGLHVELFFPADDVTERHFQQFYS